MLVCVTFRATFRATFPWWEAGEGGGRLNVPSKPVEMREIAGREGVLLRKVSLPIKREIIAATRGQIVAMFGQHRFPLGFCCLARHLCAQHGTVCATHPANTSCYTPRYTRLALRGGQRPHTCFRSFSKSSLLLREKCRGGQSFSPSLGTPGQSPAYSHASVYVRPPPDDFRN